MKNKKGFTLIELIVVISIIGFIASSSVYFFNATRIKARDAKRLSDIQQLKIAFEMFFDDNSRYPDIENDGIPTQGQIIGVGNTIDTILAPYLKNVPGDPKTDTAPSENGYFYAYDPAHAICDPVISLNRFEFPGNLSKYGYKDTDSGGDMNMDTAHYNFCFIK